MRPRGKESLEDYAIQLLSAGMEVVGTRGEIQREEQV